MYKDNLIEQIAELMNSNLIRVLAAIIKECDDRTGTWFSTRGTRAVIANKLGIGDTAVRSSVHRLVKAGFLKRPDRVQRGTYIVNFQKLKIRPKQ